MSDLIKRSKKILFILVVVVQGLLFSVEAAAQVGSLNEIRCATVSAIGGRSSGAVFSILAVGGQAHPTERSNGSNFTLLPGFIPCRGGPPNAPSNVVVIVVSSTQNDITWRDNSDNEDRFEINANGILVGSVAADSTDFSHIFSSATAASEAIATSEATFTYEIIAANSDGEGPSGETPLPPEKCIATAENPSRILVSWEDKSRNEVGFKIWRTLELQPPFPPADSIYTRDSANPNNMLPMSYTDTDDGLMPDKTYYYAIFSYIELNKAGCINAMVTTSTVTTTWEAKLNVSDVCGGVQELIFGLAPTATDDIDGVLGEAALPPAPPGGIFDARFQLPDPTLQSVKDYRNDSQSSADWVLKFQPGPCGHPLEFSWDNSALPDFSYFLKDIVGGALVNVDMKRNSSHSVSNTGITSLRIEFNEEPIRDVNVLDGWNIISVPLLADDMSKTGLFPSASSSAFGFSGGYVTAATLQNGKGYWLKFDGSETVPIAGSALGVTTIPVSSGWNLVGPYDYDVSVSDITSTPTGIIESSFFGFSGGYQLASTLESGKGYWVRVSADGVLELTGGTLAKAGIFDHSNEQIGHQDWARIVFEDRGGGKATLYAAKKDMNLSRYELPPVPPTGIFDVRYTNGRNVELIGSTGKEIQISSADYPIRISVEGIELRVTEPESGGLLQSTLQSGEVLVISDPQIKVIKIEAEAAELTVQIPQDYELYQNYPNPFNPTTMIKFSLPEAGKVELSIYNMLGERVLELANQEFQAGFHHVEFQAQGFASGIYLYKIEAGNFREIRKMTILK